MKRHIPGLALAAFLAVILPLQSYLGNIGLFVFSPWRLGVELAVLFAVLASVFALVTALVRKRQTVSDCWGALLTAFLVCGYLESGVLSMGLPEINGGYMPELAVAARAWADVAVWAVVVTGLLVGVRFVRGYCHWIALGVLVLGAASLFDARKPDAVRSAEVQSESAASDRAHFEWQLDVLSNVKFSAKRNVLVFVLDSMGARFPFEVVEGDARLRREFAGFTAYTNNVAMHDCTKYGLPGLMTGVYFDPAKVSSAAYPMSMYGERSMLYPYLEAGAEVAFSPDLMPYGLTTLPVERRNELKGRQKGDWSALLLRTREVPYLSLLNLSLFRLLPYPAKGRFVYARIRKDPMFERAENVFWHEHVMFPLLSGAPLGDHGLFLGVFHSWGAHPPLTFNLDGSRAVPSGDYRRDMREQIHNSLTHLVRLFAELKRKGIYDSSLIVLCADHGNDLDRKSYAEAEYSMLWIKSEGADGDFAASAEPTSNADIAPFVRSVVDGARPFAPSSGSVRIFRQQAKGTRDGFTDIIAR